MREVALFVVIAAVFVAFVSAAPQAEPAPDAIYHSGKIVTGNERFDIVEALAVRDGKVMSVGSNREVRRLAGPKTVSVDVAGKTVLAGFYDNHIHLGDLLQEWRGGMIDAVQDWLRDVDTPGKLYDALRRRAAITPKGEWIRGDLAREEWNNARIPTRWDFDKVVPDHPVALARGPHTLVLNSMALDKAGIRKETPDPPGGWIFRDAAGVPSGRVLEAARRIVERAIPRTSRSGPTDDEVLARYRQQLKQLASLGITSVNVASVRPADLRLIQELYARHGDELPRATLQIRLSPGHDSYDDTELGVRNSIAELEALGVRTGFGNDRLKIGAVKMSIDGGMSAPIFWSIEPYKGKPDLHGAQRIPADVFYRVAKRAHELGWQLGIHAIGDAAVVMVVDALEKILAEKPREDHRHFLHHVSVMPPAATLRKMAALGIGVASQPNFTYGLGAYAEEALNEDREETQNPAKTLLDLGIHVSFGSDAAPYGPLLGMWTAVTRKGWDERVRGSREAVSVKEAIRLYTAASAFTTFDEKTRGTLEVGKAADMVVLGDDILSVNPDRVRAIPVERTIIAGKEIFVRTARR